MLLKFKAISCDIEVLHRPVCDFFRLFLSVARLQALQVRFCLNLRISLQVAREKCSQVGHRMEFLFHLQATVNTVSHFCQKGHWPLLWKQCLSKYLLCKH